MSPRVLIALFVTIVQGSLIAENRPSFFYGGNLGLAFGEVDYVEVSPMVGARLTDEATIGVQILYRDTSDERGSQSRDSTDIGTTLFGRYHVVPTLFLEANYEYIDHKIESNGTTTSNNFSSFLAGGGISTPIGGPVMTTISFLYNFNYDDDDSPYDDPWSIRFGVGFSFQ